MECSGKDCVPKPPNRETVVVGVLRLGAIAVYPPVVMAPMAGVTDGPFLEVLSRFGVGMVTSEMMSAEGFRRNDPSCRRMLGIPSRVRVPVSIQIFGADPAVMAEAARAAQDSGAAVIDINAGCPIRKIVRQGAGAALLRESDRLARIVETVKEAVAVPVTVKTRLGWDQEDIHVVETCRRLQEAGADAVTLHARTARQIYTGKADWTWIRRLKNSLSIPVIGNGDVTTPSDFHRMLRETGCDAVMIGRGALGNPWLFRVIAEQCRSKAPSFSSPDGSALTPVKRGETNEPRGLWGSPKSPLAVAESPRGNERMDWEEFRRTVRDHAELFMQEKPRALGALRKHVVWYTKGCPNSSALRARIMGAPDFSTLWTIFEEYISELAASGADLLACKVRPNGPLTTAEELA